MTSALYLIGSLTITLGVYIYLTQREMARDAAKRTEDAAFARHIAAVLAIAEAEQRKHDAN